MTDTDIRATVSGLTYAELAALAAACTARMNEIRAETVKTLRERFEQISLEEVGLSLKQVEASGGKRRGRPRKTTDANGLSNTSTQGA